MGKEYNMGSTGHSDFSGATGYSNFAGVGCTGVPGPSYGPAEDRIDQMIRLLKSIDENLRQINAKLE